MTTNWADELIGKYTVGKRDLGRMKDQLDRGNSIDKNDLRQINIMIKSMTFSMEWLETGRQPGTYRGADKRAISVIISRAWTRFRT